MKARVSISTRVQGINSLKLLQDGRLQLNTPAGEVFFSAPNAFQTIEGQQYPIKVAYRVAGDSYGFELGDYDKTHELLIDPVLSTYVGGSGSDEGKALAMLGSDVVVTGVTESSSLAGLSRIGTDAEIFVARLDADLLLFRFATFLGGSGDDEPTSITVDSASGDG